MAADHRSALPQIPGIPWWGAAILATAVALVGFAVDASSGNQALGGVFATCYVLGCVLAAAAVRQSGVFTAVIQPPLILFVLVPFAYFVFHGSTFTGIKDTLINCGYPLIERFPLMFFTSATVLLIGMARWYLGSAARRAVPTDPEAAVVDSDESEAKPAARRSRRTSTERSSRAAATATAADAPSRKPSRAASARSSSAEAASAARRSRHSLPPEDETVDPAPQRPRRRPAPAADGTDEPRRRPRSGEPPRERRDPREPRDRRPMPPLDRRGAYDRPERSDRPQRRDRSEPLDRAERPDRPQRRPRVSSDYEPYEAPPKRSSGSGTHHPISRVRYRGDAEDGEARTEHRSRPRPSRHSAPDSWDYDV